MLAHALLDIAPVLDQLVAKVAGCALGGLARFTLGIMHWDAILTHAGSLNALLVQHVVACITPQADGRTIGGAELALHGRATRAITPLVKRAHTFVVQEHALLTVHALLLLVLEAIDAQGLCAMSAEALVPVAHLLLVEVPATPAAQALLCSIRGAILCLHRKTSAANTLLLDALQTGLVNFVAVVAGVANRCVILLTLRAMGSVAIGALAPVLHALLICRGRVDLEVPAPPARSARRCLMNVALEADVWEATLAHAHIVLAPVVAGEVVAPVASVTDLASFDTSRLHRRLSIPAGARADDLSLDRDLVHADLAIAHGGDDSKDGL